MKIAVAGDSAGESLAKVIVEHLQSQTKYEAEDVSQTVNGAEPFYANIAERVANAVKNGEYDRAILICGTGIGVCIAANKVPSIRAALTHDTYSAQRATLSNNAQIITMGARVIGPELAKSIVDSFLKEFFDVNGRSAANVEALNAIDAKKHSKLY